MQTLLHPTKKQTEKQRLTAFIDPVLVKRAKVRGALEGLTISEVVEKALEGYAPKIEGGTDRLIQLKFTTAPMIDPQISGAYEKIALSMREPSKERASTKGGKRT